MIFLAIVKFLLQVTFCCGYSVVVQASGTAVLMCNAVVCIYGFCVVLTVNSDDFLKHH
jgi:hypothetical protein